MRIFSIGAVALLLALPALAGELPIRADPRLTPGAVLTTDAMTVRQPSYSKSVRHRSGKIKALIYRRYDLDKTKDKVENQLHALLCAGRLPLEQAQREIATDWIAAYQKYVGPPP